MGIDAASNMDTGTAIAVFVQKGETADDNLEKTKPLNSMGILL